MPLPTVFLVEAREYSTLQQAAPRYAALAAAMASAPRNTMGMNTRGRWVGPGPRVTRRIGVAGGVIGGGETDAAWVYQFPDEDANQPNLAATLQRAVSTALETAMPGPAPLADYFSTSTDRSRRFTVTVTPFNPQIHGRFDWWSSGNAARTQTADQFPSIIGSASNPDENPTAPTVPGVNAPPGNAASLEKYKPFLYLGAGAITLYLVWPILIGARRLANRSNPVLSFPSARTRKVVVEVVYPSDYYPEWDNKMDAIAKRHGTEEQNGSGMGPDGRDIWFEFSSNVNAAKFVHDVRNKFKPYVKQGKVSTRYIPASYFQ